MLAYDTKDAFLAEEKYNYEPEEAFVYSNNMESVLKREEETIWREPQNNLRKAKETNGNPSCLQRKHQQNIHSREDTSSIV